MNSTKNLLVIIIVLISIPVILNCTVLIYWARKCNQKISNHKHESEPLDDDEIVDMETMNKEMTMEDLADE